MDIIADVLYEFSSCEENIISETCVKALTLLFKDELDVSLLKGRQERWNVTRTRFKTTTPLIYAKIFWLLTGDEKYFNESAIHWNLKIRKGNNIFEDLYKKIIDDPKKGLDETQAIKLLMKDYEEGKPLSKSTISYLESEKSKIRERIVEDERRSLRKAKFALVETLPEEQIEKEERKADERKEKEKEKEKEKVKGKDNEFIVITGEFEKRQTTAETQIEEEDSNKISPTEQPTVEKIYPSLEESRIRRPFSLTPPYITPLRKPHTPPGNHVGSLIECLSIKTFQFLNFPPPVGIFSSIIKPQVLEGILIQNCLGEQAQELNNLTFEDAWKRADRAYFVPALDNMLNDFKNEREEITTLSKIWKTLLTMEKRLDNLSIPTTTTETEVISKIEELSNNLISMGIAKPITVQVRPKFVPEEPKATVRSAPEKIVPVMPWD